MQTSIMNEECVLLVCCEQWTWITRTSAGSPVRTDGAGRASRTLQLETEMSNAKSPRELTLKNVLQAESIFPSPLGNAEALRFGHRRRHPEVPARRLCRCFNGRTCFRRPSEQVAIKAAPTCEVALGFVITPLTWSSCSRDEAMTAAPCSGDPGLRTLGLTIFRFRQENKKEKNKT
ncbi:hypothetical protein NDU88_010082 [Pleurodeles waltl]|uniref:Uncharacterized protein n=1 Tax=Pleurodeles waltl TaxID=8319 RepID=A0AAV7S1J9_PLEWA|nr:hypothetical protein NDU88_010082 [Pleurodeles waltl]